MNIQRDLQKNQLVWTVTIPAEERGPFEDAALVAFAQNLELPGFRKGKVPLDAARSHIGAEELSYEAAFLASRKIAAQILDEEKEEWIGQPNIEIRAYGSGKDLIFLLTCVLLQKISLGNWQKRIKTKRMAVNISEDDVAKALEHLRKSRAVYRAVTRPAQKGDFVEISFMGREGGVQIEGLTSARHPFIVGEGKFIDGFEDHVVGMTVGESRDFSLAIPKEWANAVVAGRTIDFHVTLDTLQERLLPEPNDEFARALGAFESLDALKKSISDGLRIEKEDAEKRSVRLKALDEIADGVAFDVPALLQEQEAERLFSDFKSSIESGGYAFDEYLSQVGKNQEELREDFKKGADKRVKIAVVLRELARELAIEPTDEEIEACVAQQMKQDHGITEAGKIDLEERRNYCRGIVRNEKVFSAIEDIVAKNSQ